MTALLGAEILRVKLSRAGIAVPLSGNSLRAEFVNPGATDYEVNVLV
jgi:hypothetical protein